MKLYGAIDLHSNNNVTVLFDEQDQVRRRCVSDLPNSTNSPSSSRGISLIAFSSLRPCADRVIAGKLFYIRLEFGVPERRAYVANDLPVTTLTAPIF